MAGVLALTGLVVIALRLVRSGARNDAPITAGVLGLEILVADNLALIVLSQNQVLPDGLQSL